MQSYTEIPSAQSLQSSLALLLNNDKTALSNSSGSAFPTTNLQVGMTCFRTDQNKLYILKDATPTWSLIWDFNAPAVTQGADIGGGVDLNTMTATGWYHQNTNPNATGGTNYPAAKAGLLKVHTDGSMTYQQYQTHDGVTELYFRSCYNGTWGTWRKVITLDNDGAGSGLDADLLDGMQSGNASGNIPVSNGTVNTNLNADMVDGKHAGNASGNIPVSNGTVNTDLNADKLDDYHADSFVRTINGQAPIGGNVSVVQTTVNGRSGAVLINANDVGSVAARGFVYITESGNFTVPNGVYRIHVFVKGGGGGGGNGRGNSSGAFGGGGRGGLAGMGHIFLDVLPGGVIPVTVGAGGGSVTSGGTTSFGAAISATGGSGGSSYDAISNGGKSGNGANGADGTCANSQSPVHDHPMLPENTSALGGASSSNPWSYGTVGSPGAIYIEW